MSAATVVAAAAGERIPSMLLLGDSQTQYAFRWSERGWAAQLKALYERKLNMVDRGLSGYNTRMVLHYLPALLADDACRPAYAFVWLGCNDAALAEHNAHQHVPLDEYARNLRAIVAGIRAHAPDCVVLLASALPVDEDALLSGPLAKGLASAQGTATPACDRSSSVAAKYNAAARSVADACGARFVDLHAAFAEHAAGLRALLSDGLHVSPAGADLVTAKLLEALAACGADVQSMPFWLPHWSVVHVPPPPTGSGSSSSSSGSSA